MQLLTFAGRAGLWVVAGVLWLLVLFALVCMVSFIWFQPPEERGIAGIWFWIAVFISCPALLLTARLAGFWHLLFPNGS